VLASSEVELAARDDVERTLGVGSHSRARRRLAFRVTLLLLAAAVVVVGAREWMSRRVAAVGPRFETAMASRGDLRATVTATGSLEALGSVDVGCEVSGRVQHVLVDYNATVTKGQLLADLDPVQLRAEANQALSQVAAGAAGIDQANATKVEARQALDRAEAQSQMGLVATKDLESARATYARALATVESAKATAAVADATLKSARWKLGKTKIVSPIDGMVLSRSVEPGQTLQAAFTTPVLFRIASDLAHLELEVQVDEADIGRVREGQIAEFHVDAYPSRTFSSRVQSVHNDATTSNNVVTYEAVLSVDNSEHLLRPGMTATASILTESRRNALLVPNSALRFAPPAEPQRARGFPGPPPGAARSPIAPEGQGDLKSHVYVLRGGVPAVVFVRTGATDGKSTEVLEGDLAPGAEVLTDVIEEVP
jgi:HlyD family secretion protein